MSSDFNVHSKKCKNERRLRVVKPIFDLSFLNDDAKHNHDLQLCRTKKKMIPKGHKKKIVTKPFRSCMKLPKKRKTSPLCNDFFPKQDAKQEKIANTSITKLSHLTEFVYGTTKRSLVVVGLKHEILTLKKHFNLNILTETDETTRLICLVHGPHGSGKSTLIRHCARLMNMHVIRLTCETFSESSLCAALQCFSPWNTTKKCVVIIEDLDIFQEIIKYEKSVNAVHIIVKCLNELRAKRISLNTLIVSCHTPYFKDSHILMKHVSKKIRCRRYDRTGMIKIAQLYSKQFGFKLDNFETNSILQQSFGDARMMILNLWFQSLNPFLASSGSEGNAKKDHRNVTTDVTLNKFSAMDSYFNINAMEYEKCRSEDFMALSGYLAGDMVFENYLKMSFKHNYLSVDESEFAEAISTYDVINHNTYQNQARDFFCVLPQRFMSESCRNFRKNFRKMPKMGKLKYNMPSKELIKKNFARYKNVCFHVHLSKINFIHPSFSSVHSSLVTFFSCSFLVDFFIHFFLSSHSFFHLSF
jgi:energy-coupling factor transporter ATP-binding protein EcfA2